MSLRARLIDVLQEESEKMHLVYKLAEVRRDGKLRTDQTKKELATAIVSELSELHVIQMLRNYQTNPNYRGN